ncbi:MAG: S41 family peptidase [Blastocatellia bacterium]
MNFIPTRATVQFLTTVVLLVTVQPALRAQTPSPSFTSPDRAERLRLFDQVWRAVNDGYHDPRFNGVDWRAQRQIFRPLAEMATNRAELYLVLRRMLGTLGDAHTRIYSPEESFDRYHPTGLTVGVTVRPVEGRATITWVEPESEAARAGLRAGFHLLQIDGQPVEQLLDRIRRELVSSSTLTAFELQSYDRLFQVGQGTRVELSYTDDRDHQHTVTLTRRLVEFQRRATARQLSHRIGYVEVTGFGQEVEHDFDRAMQQLEETRGLIIDLRNNGGGFVNSVLQIASYFFPEQTDLGEFITRDGRSTKRYTGLARLLYRAPVVILVSSRTASGAEILAAAMQEHQRAVVIGTHESTCGCLLGVSRTIRLADGGRLNISDTDFRTARGRRIEGRGVKPDSTVNIRATDLLLGSDQPLLAAFDQLGRRILFGHQHGRIDFSIKLPRDLARDGADQTNLRDQ